MNRFKALGVSLLAVGALLVAPGTSQAATPKLTAAQADAIAAQTPPKGRPNWLTAKPGKVAAKDASVVKTGKSGLKGRLGDASKAKSSLTGCAPSCYYYGVGRQVTAPTGNKGASANFGIFAPPLASKSYHSLAEIALQSADEKQIVEVGWIVDNTGVNGTDFTNPHIFAYSWRNDVGQGYNGGSGWTNYSQRTTTIGASLASYVNTTERTFAIQYVAPVAPATTGRWWLGFNDGIAGSPGWMGSFAESSWTTGTSPVASFNHGDFNQFFGETVQSVDAPCTVMGNGISGSAASGGALPAAGPARIVSASYDNGPVVDLQIGSTSALQPVGNQSASHKTFTYGGPKQTTTPC
jgi:hypothetical protein